MTPPAQERRSKQQADGVLWLERLSSKGKGQSTSCGFIFLLVVGWEASDALMKNAGYSILHWPDILIYLGVAFLIALLWLLLWLWFMDTPNMVQALLFYGVGMGFWSIALWITQSIELMWIVAVLFFCFLGMDFRMGVFSLRQKL